MATALNYMPGGVDEELRALFGGLLTANWKQAMVARGYGYHIDIGAFSTPIAGDTTVLDQDRPVGVISCPAGFTVVPLRLAAACQLPLGATDSDESEILFAVDRAAAYAMDGTVTTESALNMRTNVAGNTGPLTVRSAATGNITNPTLGYELAHAVKIFETKTDVGVMWNDLALLYEPNYPPFLVGPCAIYIYWAGTVQTTGFFNGDVLAFPSGLITPLA